MRARSSVRRRPPEPLIVLAQSGRALAVAARAAGFAPRVVDRFGDLDTRASAASWHPLAVAADGELDDPKVLATVRRLWQDTPAAPLVWGGGLESRPALLEALASEGPVMGSDPDRLRALQDPIRLGARLRGCGVMVPAMRWRITQKGGWLRKQAGAAGGAHVVPATAPGPARPGDYFQRQIPGLDCSVTLLADGSRVRILGWNRLLSCTTGAFGHAYQGAVGGLEIPTAAQARISAAATAIVRLLGWRGLCGLDFILSAAGTPWVIDLNPRPTATVELHLAPGAAMRAHLAACGGSLPAVRLRGRPRGQRVLYAVDPIAIPNSLDWPQWVSDRPPGGTEVPTGAPICSIQAAGKTPAQVERTLQARARQLAAALCPPR